MEMKVYSDHGINWIWYLAATHNPDGTLTVLHHYRLHCDRDIHPANVEGSFRLVEDEERTVTDAILNGTDTVKVSNPQHVFSYKG